MSSTLIRLKKLKIDEIHKNYGIGEDETKQTDNCLSSPFTNTNTNTNRNSITLIDECTVKHECCISIPVNGKKYSCFWDRNPIPDNVSALSCPIYYNPQTITKSYYSHISKGNYTLKSDLTTDMTNNDAIKCIGSSYYTSEGVFCSTNCVQAWINEHYTDPKYDFSSTLLLQIVQECNPNKEITKIIPAGDWRILNEYGGYKTIEEFRENFNKIKFENKGRIQFNFVGNLYEEKIKIY